MRTVSLDQYLAAPGPFGGRVRPDGKVDVFETQAERDAAVPTAKAYPPLTPRQIRLGLLQAGKLAAVDTAINALPEAQKAAAKITWEYAIEYRRNDPLVVSLGAALGLTPAQIDSLWEQAAQL